MTRSTPFPVSSRLMPKRYFDLFEDMYVPGRWYLDDPVDSQGREVDPWQFESGERLDVEGHLRIPMDRSGKPLDFSVTPVGGAPVVHERVASVFANMAPKDVQLVPVNVEGQTNEFFILNVTRVVKCINDKASAEVQYWKPEDGRPEKTGSYRAVHGMRIDPSKVSDTKVFRPWG